MPSDVPGVRSEIEALIGQGQATVPDAILQNWASRLRQDRPISNCHSSPTMTSETAAKIRELHARGMSHSQIAAELGINHGRVSEVLTGKKW